jgi:hypothetical protein
VGRSNIIPVETGIKKANFSGANWILSDEWRALR